MGGELAVGVFTLSFFFFFSLRFNGATRFWEALSIGLAKGSAHGFGLMARGIGE